MDDRSYWKSICRLSRLSHNASNWTHQWVQCLWPSSHLLTPVCQASSAVSSETLSALSHRSLALGVTLPLTKTNAAIFLASVIGLSQHPALGRRTDTPQTPTETWTQVKTVKRRWWPWDGGVIFPFRPIEKFYIGWQFRFHIVQFCFRSAVWVEFQHDLNQVH